MINDQHDESTDDLEMLEAIRAAFGDDAIDLFDKNAESDVMDTDDVSLANLVKEIDEATASVTTVTSAPIDEVTEKHLVIEVSGSTFGIPMANVHEIQRVPRVTYLPGVPDWILGVTNLRGNIISVVALRQLLDMEPTDGLVPTQRLVMTHSLVDDVATGLVVDRVFGIRNLAKSNISKMTSTDDKMARFLSGMIEMDERLIALLDIDKLLCSEEFRQFDAA